MSRRGFAFFLVLVATLGTCGGSEEGNERVDPPPVEQTTPIEPWAPNLDPRGSPNLAISLSGGLTPSIPWNPTPLRCIQLSDNGISYGVPCLLVNQAPNSMPAIWLDPLNSTFRR
jgi:hypothetical protein